MPNDGSIRADDACTFLVVVVLQRRAGVYPFTLWQVASSVCAENDAVVEAYLVRIDGQKPAIGAE